MKKIDYVILICVAAVLVLVSFIFFVPNSANVYNDGCKQLTKCDTVSMNSIIVVRNSTGNYTIGNICALRGYTNSADCAKYCGCALSDMSAQLSSEPIKSYGTRSFTEGTFIVEEVK